MPAINPAYRKNPSLFFHKLYRPAKKNFTENAGAVNDLGRLPETLKKGQNPFGL
jgi:hypothetical protein